MTVENTPDSDLSDPPIYQELTDRIEKSWQDEFADYFYQYRVMAYSILGLTAIILSFILGASTALVVVTSLLYLAIVFVNLELKEIQDTQNDILARESRPLVEVANVDFAADPCQYFITNYGKGYATALTVALKIQDPTDSDLNSGTGYKYLTRVSNEGQNYQRTDNTIQPTDEPVKFHGTPIARLSDMNHTVEHTLQVFLDEGIERVNFQLALVYANSLGEVGHRNLTEPLTVFLQEGMNFQIMMEECGPLGGYERDVMFNQFDIRDIIHTRDPEKLREPGLL